MISMLFKAKYSCNKFTNDLKIVVHCKSGTETGRSAQAADILKGRSFIIFENIARGVHVNTL